MKVKGPPVLLVIFEELYKIPSQQLSNTPVPFVGVWVCVIVLVGVWVDVDVWVLKLSVLLWLELEIYE